MGLIPIDLKSDPIKEKLEKRVLWHGVSVGEIEQKVREGLQYVTVCYEGIGRSQRYAEVLSEGLNQEVAFLSGGVKPYFNRLDDTAMRERYLHALSKVPHLFVHTQWNSPNEKGFFAELKRRTEEAGNAYYEVFTPQDETKVLKSFASQIHRG